VSRLRVVPIVEGHGEVDAFPILLRRIWQVLGGEFIDVLTPIRGQRDRLIKPDGAILSKVLQLAAEKLRFSPGESLPGLIMILLDAEDDLACQLGPDLLQRANACRPDVDIACVIANRCYETWFAAAVGSLQKYLDTSRDAFLPRDPENENLRKAWVAKRIRQAKYSETVDQPRLTAAMDLSLCRANSRSFDKLCRDLEDRLHTKSAG
jgi:hypothetical protein